MNINLNCIVCHKRRTYEESQLVEISQAWFSDNVCIDCAMALIDGSELSDKCRVCGCTQIKACILEDGRSCFWILPGICSKCAVPVEVSLW